MPKQEVILRSFYDVHMEFAFWAEDRKTISPFFRGLLECTHPAVVELRDYCDYKRVLTFACDWLRPEDRPNFVIELSLLWVENLGALPFGLFPIHN